MHPAWWFNLLTTAPLEFASLSSWGGTVADLVNRVFDPTATISDVEWLRQAWPGPLVVKGILTPDDARAVVDAGREAVGDCPQPRWPPARPGADPAGDPAQHRCRGGR